MSQKEGKKRRREGRRKEKREGKRERQQQGRERRRLSPIYLPDAQLYPACSSLGTAEEGPQQQGRAVLRHWVHPVSFPELLPKPMLAAAKSGGCLQSLLGDDSSWQGTDGLKSPISRTDHILGSQKTFHQM